MNRLARARRGFTVQRVGGAADLAVKFAAIIIAVSALAVVFFGPKIEIRTHRQTFLDRDVLLRSYQAAGEELPGAVSDVVTEYNGANTRDLLSHTNATSEELHSKDVCREHPQLVAVVFPITNCDAEHPVIGRNHFWERLLIEQFGNQPGLGEESAAALANTALPRLYDAQYVKVQTLIRNNGHARAVNVNVRVPTGFIPASEDQSVSAFTLSPDDVDVERFYRTVSGIRESQVAEGDDSVTPPVTRFAVNWERDPNSQAGVVVYVGIALFVLWVAILFNDSRIRARDKKADSTTSSSTEQATVSSGSP